MSSAPYCTACGATIPADAGVCPICQAPVAPVTPATAISEGPRPSSEHHDQDDEAPMQAQLRAQLE
ncbi:MAG: hypothetical protein ACREL2_09940, partial [Gemmatimonadales bacterium]